MAEELTIQQRVGAVEEQLAELIALIRAHLEECPEAVARAS